MGFKDNMKRESENRGMFFQFRYSKHADVNIAVSTVYRPSESIFHIYRWKLCFLFIVKNEFLGESNKVNCDPFKSIRIWETALCFLIFAQQTFEIKF